MAVIQGSWGMLLAPGLLKDFYDYIEAESVVKPGSSDNDINLSYIVRKRKPVRELHVYDLGDGMLVPCQLVDDLFA